MNNGPAWNKLVREVAEVVRIMPLWKLQTVGREHLDFLYANTGAGNTVTLRPGVAFCFRKFHPLISDLGAKVHPVLLAAGDAISCSGGHASASAEHGTTG